MITILIPIGEAPFFPQALVKNIKETIGITDYGLVFLATRPSKRLLDDLNQISGDFSLYVGDFDPSFKGVHLHLLDWAISELPLSDWVYVQHADMFWVTQNWFSGFQKKMKDSVAIMPSYCATGHQYKHHKYLLGDRNLVRTHDFSGLYHKPTLLKHNLKFIWTPVKDCKQQSVLNHINDIKLVHEARRLTSNDVLDGSDLIGLFLECLSPGLVSEVDEPLDYHHCWDLFGLSWAMKRVGNVIQVKRTFDACMVGMPSYAWCSSFLYDYGKWKDVVFPWASLKFMMNPVKSSFTNFVAQYKTECRCLGNHLGNIRKIIFKDREFILQPQML